MTLEEIKNKYPTAFRNTINYVKRPEISEALDDKDFDKVFSKCSDSITPILACLIIKAGIDPLQYLTYVPRKYFEILDIRSITLGPNIQTMSAASFEGAPLQYIDISKTKIKTLPFKAFSWCRALTSIQLPEGLESIGRYAFESCSHLKEVVIPNGIKTIGEATFLGSGLTSITIPNSVTEIDVSAFNNCRSLTSVTIPNSVTTIEDSAFATCESLTSITIPDSVTRIGRYTFAYCESLKEITIPSSVHNIGYRAFENCSALTHATILGDDTYVELCAFYDCENLQYIYSKTRGLVRLSGLPSECKIVYI